jgi:archaeosine synthase
MVDFRGFLEKSSFDDMNIISTLKILDNQYKDVLKLETPITQTNKAVNCLGPSSYNRPDFQAFRERLVKNFIPEPWTRVIILIPCSAKKPYSDSKSHRRFQKILRKFAEFPDFQEIILTSPLGAIPRQLENIYPVNSYDISVTGDWDNKEIEIAVEMLVSLLERFDDRIPVLCHFKDPGYLKIVEEARSKVKNKFYFTEPKGNLTTKESLMSFEIKLRFIKESLELDSCLPENPNLLRTWTRKFFKIIDYQFGQNAGGQIFFNGIKIWNNKKSNLIEISDQKTREKLGKFNFSTGQIEINLIGANRLRTIKNDMNYIVFDGQTIKGNTLFRPGILNCSSNLAPKDLVLIYNKNHEKIIGLGSMIVSSSYIKNSKTGKVADVYEKL